MLVGRFGFLKTGSVRNLWQSEAEFITNRNLSDWVSTGKVSTAGVGEVFPLHTSGFDLSRIDWLKECHSALKRMSRSELGEVAHSMRKVGCTLPAEPETRTFTREAMFECLYEEAKRLKWDQAGYGDTEMGQMEKGIVAQASTTNDVEAHDVEHMKLVRTHDKKGKFVADDPETDVDEAWEEEGKSEEIPATEEEAPQDDSYRKLSRAGAKKKTKNTKTK
jgi:hypothetical protein